MREYPIIFKGPMVRAILAGRKTQTRRPLLLQSASEILAELRLDCPFGKVGDTIPEELWEDCKWNPSIHMPKKYARIWLEITGVCAERLQAISEDDAIEEGAIEWMMDAGKECPPICQNTGRIAFKEMWDSIYGEDPAKSWDANPFVWVIEFKKVQK